MPKMFLKFAVAGSVVAQSVSDIPWQCDCEADMEHCSSAAGNVTVCTILVEIAKAVGFNVDSTDGSRGNLMMMDPVSSHTIGSYCSWGAGVHCGEHDISILYWQDMGLQGTIPTSFSLFKDLDFLDLSNNKLNGPIPALDLPRLNSLYLDGNMLTGGFPTSTFPSLRRLFLRDNQLTGALPQQLDSSMPYLRRLDVSGNQFTGDIPSDLPLWKETNPDGSIRDTDTCYFSGNQWNCPVEGWVQEKINHCCPNWTGCQLPCVDDVLV